MVKKLIIYLICSISCFCFASLLYAEPVITFFLKPYKRSLQETQTDLRKLKKPGSLAKRLLRGHLNPVSGLFATYAGFLQISNNYGQITFPRKHSKPSIYLLITPQIEPVTLFSNTLSHWEIIPGIPAAAYLMTLQEDPATGLYFWKVESTQLPASKRIPFEAIVLFINPKNIVMPTGITLTQKNESNLQLPDIYIKKGLDGVRNSLYILTLNLFFRPATTQYEKKSDRYEMLTE